MTTSPHLSRILRLDAASCAAMGLILAFARGPLAALTGLPEILLLWAGIALLPIALFMILTAGAWNNHPVPVLVVILGNVGWALASVVLLGLFDLTGLGIALVLGQALFVLLMAWLEWRGMRLKFPVGAEA